MSIDDDTLSKKHSYPRGYCLILGAIYDTMHNPHYLVILWINIFDKVQTFDMNRLTHSSYENILQNLTFFLNFFTIFLDS